MAGKILLVCHPGREDVAQAAAIVRRESLALGIEVLDETQGKETRPDLVLVLGGDGSILNGARYARLHDIPLLGVNFGHMGFLAETSRDSLAEVLGRIRSADYGVDIRMTLDVEVIGKDGNVETGWALNEAVVLRVDVAHPVHVVLAVDGQSVSTYGADGIILATPTGSTAYSFSAGGPVVWPDTEAIVMSPLAAHGLFTRPLVVGPHSVLEVDILEDNRTAPQVWLDGLEVLEAPAGSTVRVRRGTKPVRLARLTDRPFSERLVNKFSLPTGGWRSDSQTSGSRDD